MHLLRYPIFILEKLKDVSELIDALHILFINADKSSMTDPSD